MYEKFFGLNDKPFSIVPNPDYLYMSEQHANALTYLEYGIKEGAGFIVLTGEIGAGKTTLIRHMLNTISTDIETAEIFNTNVVPDQLLRLILNEFDIAADGDDKSANLDRLNRYLIEKYAQNKRVLLIVDEAQNLSNEALEEIRMLSNLHSDQDLLLQILLVGQPELKARLRTPGLSQFAQRIAVSFHLSPLQRDETARYIAHRLAKAGGSRDLFTIAAVGSIYECSRGIPRTINLLCDAALVYGYADELDRIDQTVIEAIINDKGGIGISVPDEDKDHVGSQGPSGSDIADLLNRMSELEAEVSRLQDKVDYQVQDFEDRAYESQEQLENLVNRLIKVERKRSDSLLLKYSRLKSEFDELVNRQRDQQSASETTPEDEGKQVLRFKPKSQTD